jgi:hypothetical protein
VRGRLILVTPVGRACGSKAAAAALACAGSEPDSPGLLVNVGGARPRPTLLASSGARELEERLAVHRPDLSAASRGQTCHVTVGEGACKEALCSVLPLSRDFLTVVCLAAGELHEVVDELGTEIDAVVLRADFPRDKALTALAAADLISRGFAVSVLDRSLAWIPARRALFGALPGHAPGGLSSRFRERLLG